jgi:ribosomal protein S2
LKTLYGNILFVNTNPFCNKSVASAAKNGNCFYLNGRWIPGILTNVKTLGKRLERINEHTKQQRNQQLFTRVNKLITNKNKGLYFRKQKILFKIQSKYFGLKKYFKIFLLYCLV